MLTNRMQAQADHRIVCPTAAASAPSSTRSRSTRKRIPATPTEARAARCKALQQRVLAHLDKSSPIDPANRDKLVHQLYKVVEKEIQPSTMAAAAAIRSIASDYVKLAIAWQWKEMQPPLPEMDWRERSAWDKERKSQAELSLMELALTQLLMGQELRCPSADARQLAETIVKLVESTLSCWREGPAEPDQMNPWDVYDHWRFELGLAIILVCPQELGDYQWLVSVLTGKRQPDPMEKRQLHRLLAYQLENWWHWLAETAQWRQCVSNKVAHHHAELGVLDESEMTRLESSIERRLLELLRESGP